MTLLTGLGASRGPEDELYIRTILSAAAKQQQRANTKHHRTNPKLCIMDARAFASAVANGYVGGGRENPGMYENRLGARTYFYSDRLSSYQRGNFAAACFFFRALPECDYLLSITWQHPCDRQLSPSSAQGGLIACRLLELVQRDRVHRMARSCI